MRVFLSAVLIAAACLAAPVHAADHPHAADVAAINRVVEQFKAAIVAHDGKTLDTLFLQDHDSWLVVAAVDDATWATVKERNPKARRVLADSRKQFVEFVQNNPKSIEERFYNVRIDTNGAVGSVWFDFDFVQDGKVTNRGSETWQMVRAEDGWKIGAMLYSMGK
ncbi:nuclear transport factor 2 family protein [Massilia norwichensis]|jgi:hypothetical protein|uniref:Nuclear transport factor 2 family protein n=1 Tax=Massilia norwichensis TaxID=1442366 RepID=A0ABT2A570_9BURK|nr:nuclear transport factor 2 family protein [Massilia norwichensis]MCS0588975.1 nuclear transport factor 2 family protein [Massilia norwichensis]